MAGGPALSATSAILVTALAGSGTLAISRACGAKLTMRRRLRSSEGSGDIGDAVAVEIGDGAHVERARAGDVIGGVGQLGGLAQVAAAPAPQFERADHMRLAHQRDVGFAVAVEIGDAGGIEPAMRRAERRRLGDDLVLAVALGDHRQAGAALEIGFHHDDLVVAVAVEIGEPRLEILEHGVVLEPDGLAFAVARFDHQAAGLDLVAENAVVVARGRLGQPGAGDVALCRWRRGRRAARRPEASAVAGVSMKASVILLAGEHDLVPEPAGIDPRLAVDGLDRRHARRRVDALHAPFGGLARRRPMRTRHRQANKDAMHCEVLTMPRGAAAARCRPR